jgi:uroporphyrinogen decarboxylase
MVHLCGDHTSNLVHWVDMQLPPRTIFSIGLEMDLEKTGKVLGKDYVLAGNINTSLLQMGSYQDVFDEARRCLNVGMKHQGGYILMPACELPPDTPLENIEAVAQALYEYGYY